MDPKTPRPPSEVLFGKGRRALLELFLFYGRESRFYLAQLARLTGCSPGHVQRELGVLCEAGIVVRHRWGKHPVYEVDEGAASYAPLRELLLAEVTLTDLVRRALTTIGRSVTSAFVCEVEDASLTLVVVGILDEAQVSEVLRRRMGERAKAVAVRTFLLHEIVRLAMSGDRAVNEMLDGELTFVVGTAKQLAVLVDRPVG